MLFHTNLRGQSSAVDFQSSVLHSLHWHWIGSWMGGSVSGTFCCVCLSWRVTWTSQQLRYGVGFSCFIGLETVGPEWDSDTSVRMTAVDVRGEGRWRCLVLKAQWAQSQWKEDWGLWAGAAMACLLLPSQPCQLPLLPAQRKKTFYTSSGAFMTFSFTINRTIG